MASEIIKKIRSPRPPRIRPRVSKQAAPYEYHQIMTVCWDEVPEMRMTFEEINRKFKEINRGK